VLLDAARPEGLFDRPNHALSCPMDIDGARLTGRLLAQVSQRFAGSDLLSAQLNC
jgi:hypothetical protein